MRKDTMDLGGVTPLIIREFGDGSVKEFTMQSEEKKIRYVIVGSVEERSRKICLKHKEIFK